MGESLRLVYNKTDLDDAFKDKRFGDNVRVELLFESLDEYTGEWYILCVLTYLKLTFFEGY